MEALDFHGQIRLTNFHNFFITTSFFFFAMEILYHSFRDREIYTELKMKKEKENL